jgi:hypothetical protein
MSCGHTHSPDEPCSAVKPLLKALKMLTDGNINLDCCTYIFDDDDFSLSDIPEVHKMTSEQKAAICFLVTTIMRVRKMKTGDRISGVHDTHSLVIVKTGMNSGVFSFRTLS